MYSETFVGELYNTRKTLGEKIMKRVLILSGLIAAMAFAGCGKKADNPPIISTPASVVETVSTPVESVTEWVNEPDNSISEEDKAKYTDFFAQDYIYGFLLSNYPDASEADVNEIFYMGDSEAEITDDDYSRYEELAGYAPEGPVRKISDEKVNEILTKNTGYDYDAMRTYFGSGYINYVHDYENSVYYIEGVDTNYYTYDVVSGFYVNDNIVVMTVRPSEWCDIDRGTGYNVGQKEVALEVTEEYTHFLSCRDLTDLDVIDEYCYDITLQGKGKVKLYSYMPKAGNEDVTFKLIEDGNIYQTLYGQFDDNFIDMTFDEIEDIGFGDFDNDGLMDMIDICSYTLENNQKNLEYKVYSSTYTGYFVLDVNESAFVKEHYNGKSAKEAFETLGYLDKVEEPWREVYLEKIASGEFGSSDYTEGGIGGYTFIYLDDDEIPELVYVGDYEAEGCQIMTSKNGEADIFAFPRLWFTYQPRRGLLANSEGNMGYYWDTILELKDGKFSVLASGTYEMDMLGDYGDEEPPTFYKWDGKDVTEEQYYQNLGEVYSSDYSIAGYDWRGIINYDDVMDYLNCNYSKSFY